mmetsp:Transcript_87529/g.155247  ORF Transcript_87529/g.155247 Transcript_87529/m.155247 type:complete len:237 (-) Transcript_87529:329-1039(-)
MAASRTFESVSDRNCVITRTPSACRISTRAFMLLPQCQRRRSACRTISVACVECFGNTFGKAPLGSFPRKPTTLAMRPVPRMSRMPLLAYMVTAAKVCSKFNKQSARDFVAGRSGSVAQRYWVMPTTVPWSTTCWQPSLKMVMDCIASATCSFTNSSSQLKRSFANLGSVGPDPTAFVSLSERLELPMGSKPLPPMRRDMLLMTRAASRRTGIFSCISKWVAAEITSELIAMLLFS